ncbi:MAG: hypothetical protein QM730_02385 [Anaerolineales bacterium]
MSLYWWSARQETAVAYAQAPTSAADMIRGHGGPGGEHGPLGTAELEAAAKALGITTDELSTALQTKTLEQIATEKGVDIQTVRNAIEAVRPLRLSSTELDAAAKALGMTTDELTTAMQSGKTLAQLATDKGVDLQKVQDAINAAHKEGMRAQIDQAVTDGTMTQDKANWLLEGLDKGYLDGPGFPGFGGHHGHEGFGQSNAPAQTPSAQPTQNAQ